MSDIIAQWTKQAARMRSRELTKEETTALNEEVLKGQIHPDTDSRKRKRALRRAIDSVRPGRKPGS